MKGAKRPIDEQYTETTHMLKAWSKKYFHQKSLDPDVINELRVISKIINTWREENDKNLFCQKQRNNSLKR